MSFLSYHAAIHESWVTIQCYKHKKGKIYEQEFVIYKSFISSFKVKVTKREDNTKEEKFIRTLNKGDFFGEKALQG